ncbi:uncharacterized protein LOC130801125 [Amaranthus tricolor]|uniref:uncharacterized protein LOC130801125 n=1 Tax=Amaranthus tricolor TaxID=29722 RepID=UPI00258CA591|nr:uncharacterized protein LOC130801125 [Amaranthus tricolor]
MIGSYKDKVLCDVLDMSACHLLLGRPWQYDRKTTYDGFANTYTVRHEVKLKALIPLPPQKTITPPLGQNLQLMNRKACEREIKSQEEVYLMFTKEIDQPVDLPGEVKPLLHEYADVFPVELPPRLLRIRGIEHQIDLIPGAALPNRPAYRTNHVETKEL